MTGFNKKCNAGLKLVELLSLDIFHASVTIYLMLSTALAYPEGFPLKYTGLGTQTDCLN